MRVLSLGAGVQSSTLLLMAVHGEIQIDRAIFADTQWEPGAVYRWVKEMAPIAERAGIPVDIVTAGNLRADALQRDRRKASIPLHVRVPERMVPRQVAVDEILVDGEWQTVYETVMVKEGPSGGMLRRQCTKEYKVRPVQRRLRELGASAQRPVELLIGISRDEAQRVKDSRVKYAEHAYPLVDEQITRSDAVGWLASKGYPEPPKSACIGCPFMDNRRWREMRDNRPDEWQDAVEFDAAVRNMTRINGEAFLHRSLLPLPMVDLSTPHERAANAGQLDLFDDISDGECGAFSCFGGAEAALAAGGER